MLKTTFFAICLLLQSSVDFHDRSAREEMRVPTITFIYMKGGTPFDRGCEEFLGKAAEKWAIDEASALLNEFQQRWDNEGTTFLKTALKEVGVPFPYGEMQATFTVCDLPSVSSPLIINVKRFLPSAPDRLPQWAFPELVFHEVMHSYVRPVYDTSSLLKKYPNEPIVVRNHLHEMALEKFVLVALQKDEILQWLDDRYRNKFPPAYKRAWEIVNDIEGYQSFVDELKSMPDLSYVKSTQR